MSADSRSSGLPTFTVICPVHNEELSVPIFLDRMLAVFAQLEGRYRCDLVFLDNDSTDSTRERIAERARERSDISLVALSRNVGYQCSLECGLRSVSSDLNAIIDVDCEDPPELLPEFLKLYEQGYDIVYGERVDRPESAWMRLARKAYYRLTRFIADDHFVLDMAEFCIMSRRVREAVIADRSSFPFIRASIGRVGFSRKNVPYRREARAAGKTHYNLPRMTIYAIAGMLSSSTFVLRLPAYLFVPWAILETVLFATSFVTGSAAADRTMVFLGLLYCGFTLAAIGLYVARTYKNGLGRPNYFVDDRRSIRSH